MRVVLIVNDLFVLLPAIIPYDKCVNLFSAEDVKRLNDKLVETNTAKIDLQLKLDEIQSSEVSIQVKNSRASEHASPLLYINYIDNITRLYFKHFEKQIEMGCLRECTCLIIPILY